MTVDSLHMIRASTWLEKAIALAPNDTFAPLTEPIQNIPLDNGSKTAESAFARCFLPLRPTRLAPGSVWPAAANLLLCRQPAHGILDCVDSGVGRQLSQVVAVS